MTKPSLDPNTLVTEGFAALTRGDPESARLLFSRAMAAGAGGPAAWFGTSVACRHLGAWTEADDALDEILKLDGSFVPALIGKGDLKIRRSDRRAASSFYGAAIRVAKTLPSIPNEWQSELVRVEATLQQMAREFAAHLDTALAEYGQGEAGTERLRRAIDLLLGRRMIYLQQPKHFYFPELPQIEFYGREYFSWAAGLESKTELIESELRSVIEKNLGFVPYIQRETRRPSADNPLLDDPSWSAFFLIKDGSQVDANAMLCPATMAALRQVPLCRIDGRTPTVLFSLLRPGTRIRPHHGYMNARLICHLPLIIPDDCGLRVGNETRPWRKGELVAFDDSIEHEAWNLSQELRVVMIFDVWRPELTAKERTLVAAMLEAVSKFDGPHSAWIE